MFPPNVPVEITCILARLRVRGLGFLFRQLKSGARRAKEIGV